MRPKRDWKVTTYCSGLEPEFLGQQAAGHLTLAVVGVATIQREAGHPVKTHHQFVRPAVQHPVIVDVFRQRGDVGGMVVVVLDQPQRRRIAHSLDCIEHRVEGAARGARRVLRIQRQYQYAVATLHCAVRPVQRRSTVRRSASPRRHDAGSSRARPDNPSAASPAFRCGLLSGEPSLVQIFAYFAADCFGRVLRMMPLRIGHHSSRGTSTTRGSDRNCLQVRLDRPCGRGRRRPEVDQQDAGHGDRAMLKFGFAKKGHWGDA